MVYEKSKQIALKFIEEVPIGGPIQVEYNGFVSYALLLGASKGEYVLMSMPTRSGSPIEFERNARSSLRFFSEGRVYGFDATVLRVYDNLGLLVLTYPEFVKLIDMRSNKRLEVMIKVGVTNLEGEDKRSGMILDLSEYGVLLGANIETILRQTEKIVMEFQLPGTASQISIRGQVKKAKTSFGKNLFGIQFERADENAMLAVREFFEENISYVV